MGLYIYDIKKKQQSQNINYETNHLADIIFHMTDLHHFYHVYSNGKWKIPLEDHIKALKKYDLVNNLTTLNFGLVGSKKSREQVKKYLDKHELTYNVCTEVHDGWEQETMDKIHEFAQSNSGYIYYAHTKTAVNINALHIDWRLSMTYYTAVQWRECVKALDEGYSAAGTHYLADGKYTDRPNEPGFFGGTFWWTHAKYLKAFPISERNNRYDAESWICNLKNAVQSYNENFIVKDFNPTHPIQHANMIVDW